MSAAVLREAAALMRFRAEAATSEGVPPPWFAVDGAVYAGTAAPHQVIAPIVTYYDDAEHVASWHPVVALAVADWLDAEARAVEFDGGTPDLLMPEALAVARAYLGNST